MSTAGPTGHTPNLDPPDRIWPRTSRLVTLEVHLDDMGACDAAVHGAAASSTLRRAQQAYTGEVR